MAAERAAFGLALGRRPWLAGALLLVILAGLVLHHESFGSAAVTGQPGVESAAAAAVTDQVVAIGDVSADEAPYPALPAIPDRASIMFVSGWGDSCHRDFGWVWDAFFVVALLLLGLSMLRPQRGSYLIRPSTPPLAQLRLPDLWWRGRLDAAAVLCVSRT